MTRRIPYLIAGVVLLFLAALASLAVVGALVGTSTNPRDVGLAVASAACGSVLGFLGLGALLLYRQGVRHDSRLATVIAVLQHVDEVRIEEVAQTIHATPAETTTLIAEAIQQGSVPGYIDPRNQRFLRFAAGFPGTVAAGSPNPAPSLPLVGSGQIRFCRECGTNVKQTSDGIFRCPNCGHEEGA